MPGKMISVWEHESAAGEFRPPFAFSGVAEYLAGYRNNIFQRNDRIETEWFFRRKTSWQPIPESVDTAFKT